MHTVKQDLFALYVPGNSETKLLFGTTCMIWITKPIAQHTHTNKKDVSASLTLSCSLLGPCWHVIRAYIMCHFALPFENKTHQWDCKNNWLLTRPVVSIYAKGFQDVHCNTNACLIYERVLLHPPLIFFLDVLRWVCWSNWFSIMF